MQTPDAPRHRHPYPGLAPAGAFVTGRVTAGIDMCLASCGKDRLAAYPPLLRVGRVESLPRPAGLA